ncbi:HD domain-containing protein [Konateibacter massiliensis]|uniref:HD domain-containing protein n=1 Tax=Konateibacter massiliensis TaxID=2002841 RepID=UPI000C16086B|nr:HD domain-containing protein [Konateibacter massiliensis]
MRDDIIKFLAEDIKKRCEGENNFFGIGCYYHIKAVVKNAVILAERYNADMEIVTIAAWLHDVASITDYDLYEEHHIHGANMAKTMLEGMNYPAEKIELIQKCIRNHRGSKPEEKTSIEEICVADADAMSHFDSLPSLFYLAYSARKYNIEEGTEFVRDKLKRSYNKMSPGSKVIFQDKYNSVMEII